MCSLITCRRGHATPAGTWNRRRWHRPRDRGSGGRCGCRDVSREFRLKRGRKAVRRIPGSGQNIEASRRRRVLQGGNSGAPDSIAALLFVRRVSCGAFRSGRGRASRVAASENERARRGIFVSSGAFDLSSDETAAEQSGIMPASTPEHGAASPRRRPFRDTTDNHGRQEVADCPRPGP